MYDDRNGEQQVSDRFGSTLNGFKWFSLALDTKKCQKSHLKPVGANRLTQLRSPEQKQMNVIGQNTV